MITCFSDLTGDTYISGHVSYYNNVVTLNMWAMSSHDPRWPNHSSWIITHFHRTFSSPGSVVITNLTYLFSLQGFSYFWHSMIFSISWGSRRTQDQIVEHKGLSAAIPQSKSIFKFIDYQDNRLEWDNSIFLRPLIPANKWRLNIIHRQIITK